MAETETITCRICLIECVEFYSLNEDDHLMLRSKLLDFVPQIDLAATLNPVACEHCTNKINEIHEFKLLCIRNENISKERTIIRQLLPYEENFVKEEFNEDVIKTEQNDYDETHRIFHCYHCSYGTDDKDVLTDHILTHCFKCIRCNYTTFDGSLLTVHQLIHSPLRILRCNVCDYTCEHACSNKNLFKCYDCGYRTDKKTTLRRHIVEHKDAKVTKCDFSNLEGHVSRIHTRVKLKFKCIFCNYDTLDKNTLIVHVRTHINEKPFKCDLCDYSSVVMSNLKAHLCKHTGKWPYNCDQCDYKTASKTKIDVHKKKHTGEKPFKCNLCDYRCVEMSNLKIHSRIHSKEKPFKCNLCNYGSNFSTGLKSHMYKHTGEWPFLCEECDYKTHSKIKLDTHKRKHTGEKPFKCVFCDYSSNQMVQLKMHLYKHSDKSPVKCKASEKRSRTRQKPFKCIFKSTDKKSLKRHEKRHPRICLIEVTNDAVFHSLNKDNDLMLHTKLLSFIPDMDLSITLNPVACNQCTVMIYQIHEFRQLCIRNEIILKNQTLLRSCMNDVDNDVEMDGDECLLVNTDIPICVEESTPDMNFYYCSHCHYGTNMKDNLIDHIFTHRLKCNHCSYTTPNRLSLALHKEIHLNIGPFQCNNCSFTCIEMQALDNHKCANDDLKVNRIEQPDQSKKLYSCHECGYQTNTNTALKAHLLIHKIPKVFLCKVCNFGAKSKKGLKSHALKHLSEEINTDKVRSCRKKLEFKCNLCDYSSSFEIGLRNHMCRHTGVWPYNCERCNYKTTNIGSLKKHTINAHRIKLYDYGGKVIKCKLCDYKCSNSGYLKMHMIKHSSFNSAYKTSSNDKIFKCTDCDYTTLVEIEFSDHKKVHTVSGNAVNTEEKEIGDLQTHIDEHSIKTEPNDCTASVGLFNRKSVDTQVFPNNNPSGTEENHFKCGLCDYTCTRMGHLQTHMYKHYLKCNRCDYKTLSKVEFFDHKKNVHLEEKVLSKECKTVKKKVKRFKCNLCDFRSAGRAYLKKHIMYKHRFKCDKCAYMALTEGELLDHKRVHVRKQVDTRKTVSVEEETFECNLCEFKSARNDHLKTHMKKHILKCDECSYTTLAENELSDHKRVHANVDLSSENAEKFNCNLCDYECDRIGDFVVHMNEHLVKVEQCDTSLGELKFMGQHTEEPIENLLCTEEIVFFRCDECDYTNLVELEFLEHKKIHAEEQVFIENLENAENEKFKCNSCDYESTRICVLQTHMNNHEETTLEEMDVDTEEQASRLRKRCSNATNARGRVDGEDATGSAFKCDLCDYRGARLSYLQLHMNKHYLKCDQCSYKTLAPIELSNHRRVHALLPNHNLPRRKSGGAEEKKFKCNLCDYKFARNAHLKAHMNKHILKCGECEYTTSIEIEFLEHQQVHAAEPKFNCNLCDYKCGRIGELQTHMNDHLLRTIECDNKILEEMERASVNAVRSNDNLSSDETERSFKCDKCDYTTLEEIEFLDHKKVHTDYNLSRSTEENARLKTHTNKHTCDECEYATLIESELSEHKKVHAVEQAFPNAGDNAENADEENFNCNFCDYKSTRIGELQTHTNDHLLKTMEGFDAALEEMEFLEHTPELERSNNLSIEETGRSEEPIDNLPGHGAASNEEVEFFNCDECEYTTLREVEFLKHKKAHAEEPVLSENSGKFKCNLCDYESTRIDDVQTHMNNHLLKTMERFNTALEEMEFLYDAEERTLPSSHEALSTEERRSFKHDNVSVQADEQATTSHETEPSTDNLSSRKAVSTEGKKEIEFSDHKRVRTEKQVHSDHNLSRRKSVSTDEKKFKCNLCDYKSTRNAHLKSHMHKHTLKCDSCNYTTLVETEFSDHKKTHAEVPSNANLSIECETGTSPTDEIDLFDRKTLHTGDVDASRSAEEKKFKCDLCDYRSVRKGYLQLHMNKHYLKCDKCEYKTLAQIEFSDHKKVHIEKRAPSIDNVSSRKGASTEEKKFKCNLCDYKSTRNAHLKTHMMKHTLRCDKCYYTTLVEIEFLEHKKTHANLSSEKAVEKCNCIMCGYESAGNDDLRTHVKTEECDTEQDDKKFKCTLCNYKCTRRSYLKTHMNKHNLKCVECNYTTLVETEFLDHKKVHAALIIPKTENTEEEKFNCTLCGYECTRDVDLQKHMSEHEGGEYASLVNMEFLDQDEAANGEEKKFKCNLCGYSSIRIGLFKAHMNKHVFKCEEFSDDNPNVSGPQYKCEFCDYRGARLSHLQRHMNKHYLEEPEILDHKNLQVEQQVDEKKFKCNLCDYRSTRNAHLQKHMNRHYFKCAACDYKTLVETEIEDHRKGHAEEQSRSAEKVKFKCEFCDFRTARNDHLEVHMNKHYLKCDQCSYKTSEEMEFLDHKNVHAEGDFNATGVEEENFKCSWCDYKCSRLGHLRMHVTKHAREFLDTTEQVNNKKRKSAKRKKFKCNVCDYKTNMFCNLKVHLYRHTGDWPFKCEECDYKTHDKRAFLKHNRKYHQDL
ncbi:hypothetical protein FQR65_LT03520 [Abscondita terminalis]|nr:hypothetical protein FQR65_LT03520 [Abscondita terminalis]